MIVLAEAVEQLEPSASVRDIAASTEAARLAGATVYTIPANFDICETAENALWHVPAQPVPTRTFWIGYIPTPERYTAIYDAARAKNLVLVNTPEEYRNAQEFDRAYPYIAPFTARSEFVSTTDAADLEAAVESLGGYPIFVKGAVQSRKARGYNACVAQNLEELQTLVDALLALPDRSRGRVILRELLPLRNAGTMPNGFPMGREFRVFVYRSGIVGSGYYWEAAPSGFDTLTEEEQRRMLILATSAARNLETPYVAVDIGQLESGEWRVIETGDAQFSGTGRISKVTLWNTLQRLT